MYAKIKELADQAIATQNKHGMEAALREISAICAPSPADGAVHTYNVPAENPSAIGGGFGMAHIKKEGAAAHPDDIEADMTPEQRARQLSAYRRDTGDMAVVAGEKLSQGDAVVLAAGKAKKAAKK